MNNEEGKGGLTCIAWRLHAPGKGHQKEYRIMVIEEFVICGWGIRRGRMQYVTEQWPTQRAAHLYAARQTQKWEERGYTLTTAPRSKVSTGGSRDWLKTQVGKRGQNPSLHDATRHVLANGNPL